MINKNELRIGNVFGFYKPLIKEMQVGFVKGIYYDTNEWYVQSDEYSDINVANGIKPIPLTPQILEVCGFESTILFIGEGDYDGAWFEWNEEDKCCYLTDVANRLIVFTEIKYLHRLQNLYFNLTDKELQVDLKKLVYQKSI